MSISKDLLSRSGNVCELCQAENELSSFAVPPKSGDSIDHQIVSCSTCLNQLNDPTSIEPNHWRCLNESIWSEVPAVQVVSYRMLQRLSEKGWAQDLLGMIYLDEETQAWAEIGSDEEESRHSQG